MQDYQAAAKQFVTEETQFHLGVIPTEQSNPLTRTLSATIAKDTAAGVKMILSADKYIPSVSQTCFESQDFEDLVADIERVIDQRKTVLLSSVGASGRMALQLDATWRLFWTSLTQRIPDRREEFLAIANCCNSLTTGGDRAMVRSVENFEDYMTFGAEQIKEAGVGVGDVVIALSECGLSASINGSALEADNRGCRTYYMFCNPKDVLCKYLDRTRVVFERENIIHMPLFVGNMAVSGSTRMQVTTVELLVAGAVLEMGSWRWLQKNLSAQELAAVGATALEKEEYVQQFIALSAQLSSGAALRGLAQAVELEAATYERGGLVTYATHEYLQDIMTDTTERQPTFTLPPFRKFADHESPISWAYVKDPCYPSDVAWQHVFRRPIKGLEWKTDDYIRMGAAQGIIDNPPKVGGDELLQYCIGWEDDPSRYERQPSLLVCIDIDGSANRQVVDWYRKNIKNFNSGITLRLGNIPQNTLEEGEIRVPVIVPQTLMNVLPHVMVKLAFNVLSTATMAKMGRVWGNWMIQVLPTNKKLIDRSTRIIASLANIPYEQACEEFFKSYYARPAGQEYKESYVVETLRRLGFDPKADF